MKLSIVLPAYNSARTLEKAVDEVIKRAKQISDSYEIIIAED